MWTHSLSSLFLEAHMRGAKISSSPSPEYSTGHDFLNLEASQMRLGEPLKMQIAGPSPPEPPPQWLRLSRESVFFLKRIR